MARIQIFYKGRRKRRNYLFIPFVVLLALVSVLMVTFYGLQKYAVISDDSVSIELPILAEEGTVLDSQGHEVVSFETVNASIVFDEPDYSEVKAVAGEDVPPMRAIFVPYTDLSHDKLMEYANRLNEGNALLLEMKPRSGQLMWDSQAELAVNYGIVMPSEQTAAMQGADRRAEVPGQGHISGCPDKLLHRQHPAYPHAELYYQDGDRPELPG